jgi:hypothetical protein
MNLKELEVLVGRLGYPARVIAIGDHWEEAFCVMRVDETRWGTWWEERGNRTGAHYTDTEAAACCLYLGERGSSELLGELRASASLTTTGVDARHPAVRALVPEDYDPRGGLDEVEWNARYWPTGDLDESGAPILAWPDPDEYPDGFASAEGREPIVLEPGTLIDHFGSQYTHLTYPIDVPFPHRGLPASYLDRGYHRYQVTQQVPVWAGPTAPAFGQPGGGTQYYQLKPVIDLVSTGFLRKVEL